MSKYAFVQQQAGAGPVRELCRMLGVGRSGYYQWCTAEPRPAPAWQPAAQQAFTRHARRYGTRRLRAELHAEGHRVGRHALRTWLRASGQQALSTRPHRPRTTQADPATVVAENRLLGQPAPTAPDRVWVGDITYLPLAGAGATWPPGATPAHDGWWAGTWPRSYSPNWCSLPWNRR